MTSKSKRDHVRKLAGQVFGSKAEAKRWLRTPAMALNQRCPAELLETDKGAAAVIDLLTRLEYCVFT
jgi:putative toxin-antitoxin system antitoxin component (TIGR02293 family)